MKKLFMILLVVLLVVPLTLTAQNDALTDDQVEQVDYVADSFAKLLGLNGVRMEGTQVIDQELIVTGQSITQRIEQDMVGTVSYENREPVAVDMTLLQSTSQFVPGQGITDTELTMDIRAVQDGLYVRVRDVSMNLLGVYPSGWVNLNEEDVPAFDLLNPDALLENTLNPQFQIPLTSEEVLDITEAAVVVDDVDLRFFTLMFDPQAIVESEMVQGSLGIFDGEQLGIDMNDLLQQMAAGMTYTMDVWIDPVNDFIYQMDITMFIDAEITLLGETFDLIQTMTNSLRYTDFDTVFEIEVPETSDF